MDPRMAIERVNRERKLIEKAGQKVVEWNISSQKSCIVEFESPELQGQAQLKLHINITEHYPQKPPGVRFCDLIPFHPNVQQNGSICIDSLQNNWTPTLTMDNLILTLFTLLIDPNPNSPANPEAANIIKNKSEYTRRCLQSMKGKDRLKEVQKAKDDQIRKEQEKKEQEQRNQQLLMEKQTGGISLGVGFGGFGSLEELAKFTDRTNLIGLPQSKQETLNDSSRQDISVASIKANDLVKTKAEKKVAVVNDEIWKSLGMTKEDQEAQLRAFDSYEQARNTRNKSNFNQDFRNQR